MSRSAAVRLERAHERLFTRKYHRERGTFPQRARHLDLAAVELDKALDQAETETDPAFTELEVARGMMHRVKAGKKRLEQERANRRVDAGPLVGDDETEPVRTV